MAVHSTALRNAQANALTTLIDAGAAAGKLKLKTASGGTQLALITLSDPSFGAASTGVVTGASFPKSDSSADATGTCAWYEFTDSDDNIILSGSSVAVGSGELNMVDTAITATQVVTVNSATYTIAAGS